MITRYERQAEEWQKVRDELIKEHGGPVTAHEVTSELQKRLWARSERLLTYDEIMEELLLVKTVEGAIADWLTARADWLIRYSTFEGKQDQVDVLRDVARKIRDGAWKEGQPSGG